MKYLNHISNSWHKSRIRGFHVCVRVCLSGHKSIKRPPHKRAVADYIPCFRLLFCFVGFFCSFCFWSQTTRIYQESQLSTPPNSCWSPESLTQSQRNESEKRPHCFGATKQISQMQDTVWLTCDRQHVSIEAVSGTCGLQSTAGQCE